MLCAGLGDPSRMALRRNRSGAVAAHGSWLVVLIVELINSAIETVVDRIGADRHELSGSAKDLGSAAVFCSIVLFAMVWLIVGLR